MTETAHETPALEMQLLTAQDGTAYLLPRALLEAARLTPEKAAAFRETGEGDDVHGLMSSLSLAALTVGTALSSYSQRPAGQNPDSTAMGGPAATTSTGSPTMLPKAY